MTKIKSYILGFITASLLFGGYTFAYEFITAWDDYNIATINNRFRDVDRILRNFGRGETDTDITYIKLYNASGTVCYVYPDAAGTGITVSTTKP